jgi:sugar diacid utilization regulator
MPAPPHAANSACHRLHGAAFVDSDKVLSPAELTVAAEALVYRVTSRIDEICDTMVARYRDEIPDYAMADERVLEDVRGVSRQNLRALLGGLERGELLSSEEIRRAREGAERRVHQGVSLESHLHAYRVWGQVVWESILEAARPDSPGEREGALRLAGRVFEHIDQVSTAAAKAYLDEVQSVWSDREMLRRDLLDALLSGQDAEAAHRHATALRVRLEDSYVVVLARGAAAPTDDVRDRPLSDRAAMHRTIHQARRCLVPSSGTLLVGLRQGEVVALFPAGGHEEVAVLKEQSHELAARTAADGVVVGVGGWHSGFGGVASSYAEARDAAEVAAADGAAGRAVAFDEIVLDHLVRSNRQASRVLEETVAPLIEYDATRQAELVATVRAYLENRLNLTAAAAQLNVHPNTVVYRLRRVRDLTGRDVHDPDDLVLLTLALRLVPGEGPSA